MEAQLIETWQIHNRINNYLIEGIEKDQYLEDKTANKGRTVGEQFAHIHNVRLMWLKEVAPEIFADMKKIEKTDDLDISFLINRLNESSTAMEKLLRKGFEENRIKGFKPHPQAFLGYLIAHESHHRGQIVISLKYCGHPVSKKVGFGLWQWGTR
ncbi:DinB family protein [Xanthomarina gelatinilytica]|uniref:DinB family protein n=1 Tax=Xanthomarina gelatinilytica TaxID=1137281 RepID=UPI003AA9A779